MFGLDSWKAHIANRLQGFARNPAQDLQICGVSTLLSYLALRTLEPFFDAYQDAPVEAVVALASLSRGNGANYLVSRVGQLRYQSAQLLEREIPHRAELRATVEQLLVGLDVVHLARQRLNSARDEWLRLTLLDELAHYSATEFVQLRRLLHDMGWQSRYDSLRALRQRNGHYTTADMVLLHDGLNDSAAHVRAAAARLLGMFAAVPPLPLIRALARVSLYDCDLETRYAAARSLGLLRDQLHSPELLAQLGNALADSDRFVRSAAAMVVNQLGEIAATPEVVAGLLAMLEDSDPYAQEAAARALGGLGTVAATSTSINALLHALQGSDANVHDAALSALTTLRRRRPTATLDHTALPPIMEEVALG
jgi:hypothetical protein